LKRWRGEPVFELHAFEACHGGVVPWNIPMRETLRLEQALARATRATPVSCIGSSRS
jgi:hypothetical protein